MADTQTQNDADKPEALEQWMGHTKNIQPSAPFEAQAKQAGLPAKLQAEREAQIKHDNAMMNRPKPEQSPVQAAMPTGPSNSVYPDSNTGVVSSQSQTPRFTFDTATTESGDSTAKKSLFKRIFGR